MSAVLPQRRIGAVDVDRTLILEGEVNEAVVEWVRDRKREGFFLVLWSARGKRYAEAAARKAGLEEAFDVVMGKPGVIVDDEGWGWAKRVPVVRKFLRRRD